MASAVYLIGVERPIFVEENAEDVVKQLAEREATETLALNVRRGNGRKTYVTPQGVANVRDATPGEK
jgi:hypothetical protein